jgi:hypothetical protein
MDVSEAEAWYGRPDLSINRGLSPVESAVENLVMELITDANTKFRTNPLLDLEPDRQGLCFPFPHTSTAEETQRPRRRDQEATKSIQKLLEQATQRMIYLVGCLKSENV